MSCSSRSLLLALFCLACLPPPVLAQANSPDAALEEMLTTDKAETFEKHLPYSLQQALDGVAEGDRTEALGKFMIAGVMKREGGSLHKLDNENSWEILDDKGERKAKVTLMNVFISGVDALLLLNAEEHGRVEPLIVGMRLEADEWRVMRFGSWDTKELQSEELRRELLPGPRNEAAAMDMLRGINGAEKKYAATYKSGFSATLKALSGLPTDQPGPDHALLVDPAMASTPAVKSGYVFRYTQLDSSHYQVTASPVEFGKTGAKSFFMDENGQIRVTSEDREASRNDSQSD